MEQTRRRAGKLGKAEPPIDGKLSVAVVARGEGRPAVPGCGLLKAGGWGGAGHAHTGGVSGSCQSKQELLVKAQFITFAPPPPQLQVPFNEYVFTPFSPIINLITCSRDHILPIMPRSVPAASLAP